MRHRRTIQVRFLSFVIAILITGDVCHANQVTVPQLAPLGIQVPTNTALKALVGGGDGEPIYRAGFTAAGDGGSAKYVYSASPCSLNAGAGDNGSQVAVTAGGCFNADFGGNGASVKVWGAKCDNSTDDGPAFTAALGSYSKIIVPTAATCRIATTTHFTAFPVSLTGQQVWPTNTGAPAAIKCDTGSSDCLSTLSSTTQKSGVNIANIVFKGGSQTGGNILHLSNTTTSKFGQLIMNNVWNGIEVDGPNGNSNTFENILIQGCRGSQGFLWTNGDMSNNSNVVTINDSAVACGSSADGIVMDGNLQTLRLNKVSIIDSGHQLYMRNTVGSTVCPGYVLANDVEFNGGSHTANFIRADCGFSVQLVNPWSYGATSGDGFAFNMHAPPSAVGSNILMITNGQLLGAQIAGRCVFLNWNNVMISNTLISGCNGDALQVGAGALRTNLSGGIIIGNSDDYCVSSTIDASVRSLFLNGTLVSGGCSLGLYHDPAEAIVLHDTASDPLLGTITSISGCGTGCTVAGSVGNQAHGSILMTAGTTPSSSGSFTMNFTLHLTPFPLCIVTPRAGGSGHWDSHSSIIMQPGGTGDSTVVNWFNNNVNLTNTDAYFLDYVCQGLA